MAICVGANGRLGIRERSFGRAQMVVWAGANGGKNVPLSQRGRISLPAGPYLSPSGVVPEMIFRYTDNILKNFEIILIAKLMVIFNTNYHELPINCCA